jgi:methylmalonyl-CoA/ethylmalonyl-CoA epimerase
LEQPSLKVKRLDHVGVVVADADAAASQFEFSLGLRVDEDEVIEGVGVRLVYLVAQDASDQCAVQLVEPLRDGPIASYLRDHGEGPHHVCFVTPAIDDALEALGDTEANVFLGGKGRRACFLSRRFGGVLVELVEPQRAVEGEDSGCTL